MVYVHSIRITLAWSEAWFWMTISESVLGIKVLGSVGKEKLVGVLNENYISCIFLPFH
jgi:hypothetical protein